MTVNYHDPVTDSDIAFKSNVDLVTGEHSLVRDIGQLPGTVATDIANSAAHLATIIASLATLDGHVDGLEGFTDGLETLITATNAALTTLQGYVDGLEALATATNTALASLQTTATALDGHVDQLEGYTDGVEGSLTALIAASGSAIAQEHATAVSPSSVRLSTGAAFYDAVKTGQLPSALGQTTKAGSVSIGHASDDLTVSDLISGTTALGAPNANVQIATSGKTSAGFMLLGGGTLVGTLVAECLLGNWEATNFLDPLTGAVTSSLAVSSPGSDTVRGIQMLQGATQVRVRVSVYTSGSSTGNVGVNNANPILGKLDTLHTDLNTYLPPAAPKMDQVGSIGTGADVQFTTQALVKGMAIKNISTSGQSLYLKHSATPTSTNSMVLLPGEWSNDIECTNANQVFMRASATGGAACYSGR